MIAITIYIVGYLVAYKLLKWLRNYQSAFYGVGSNTWKDVLITFAISFLSWLAVLIITLAWIGDKLNDTETKPPKWL